MHKTGVVAAVVSVLAWCVIAQPDRENMDRALEEVCSSADRERLKGASDGGYHYMGSAKIFAQIGKAFAEAMMTMQKK